MSLFAPSRIQRSIPSSPQSAHNDYTAPPSIIIRICFHQRSNILSFTVRMPRRTQPRRKSPARSPSRPRGLPWPPAKPTMRIKPPSRCLGSFWRQRTGSVFVTAALLLPGRSSSAGPPLRLPTGVNSFPRLSSKSFGG